MIKHIFEGLHCQAMPQLRYIIFLAHFTILSLGATSLSIMYLRELTFTVSYVQTYQDQKPLCK
jgi:hypothetical protein